jgi:hypothetical protein
VAVVAADLHIRPRSYSDANVPSFRELDRFRELVPIFFHGLNERLPR